MCRVWLASIVQGRPTRIWLEHVRRPIVIKKQTMGDVYHTGMPHDAGTPRGPALWEDLHHLTNCSVATWSCTRQIKPRMSKHTAQHPNNINQHGAAPGEDSTTVEHHTWILQQIGDIQPGKPSTNTDRREQHARPDISLALDWWTRAPAT